MDGMGYTKFKITILTHMVMLGLSITLANVPQINMFVGQIMKHDETWCFGGSPLEGRCKSHGSWARYVVACFETKPNMWCGSLIGWMHDRTTIRGKFPFPPHIWQAWFSYKQHFL
jgi:hypothetical protein